MRWLLGSNKVTFLFCVPVKKDPKVGGTVVDYVNLKDDEHKLLCHLEG